jgi:hypothetical protein
MIIIQSFEKRTNTQTGEEFYSLIVENSTVDLVRSKSEKMYATKWSCSLSCTFDEPTCQALIGTSLEGNIHRVECEPYEVVDKNTGEIRVSDHRYEFFKEGEDPSIVVANTNLVATEELVGA